MLVGVLMIDKGLVVGVIVLMFELIDICGVYVKVGGIDVLGKVMLLFFLLLMCFVCKKLLLLLLLLQVSEVMFVNIVFVSDGDVDEYMCFV